MAERTMFRGTVTLVDLDDRQHGPYVMVRCRVREDQAMAIAGLMLKPSVGPVEIMFPETLFTPQAGGSDGK